VEHEPSPHHLYDGSDRPDSNSLKMRSSSKARLTLPVSARSAPQGGDSNIPPWCLQSLIIQSGGAPAVQVPLSAGGSQGPASDATEVGRTAPEPPRDRGAALESVGKGWPAPALAERWEPSSELAATKRSAPSRLVVQASERGLCPIQHVSSCSPFFVVFAFFILLAS
jgi:hypothetical protein